jgi:hypothetical protein
MSGPLERVERAGSLAASALDEKALSEPIAAGTKKSIPNKYPHGFSFWETFEVGEAIHASAKLADIPVSAWLRQTIRLRLRLEGWLPPHGGNGTPRT